MVLVLQSTTPLRAGMQPSRSVIRACRRARPCSYVCVPFRSGANRLPKERKCRATTTFVSTTVSDTTEAKPAEAMEQPAPFLWQKQWYPVTAMDYLDPTKAQAVSLLGRPFVLWHSANHGWRCFPDECPHRLAPLSEGRVLADGTIQCSYHGWQFDNEGRCTVMPQTEEKVVATACSSPRSRVKSLPVMERGGMLWVWPDDSVTAHVDAAASSPAVSRALDEALGFGRKVNWYVRDLPYSYDVLVENLVDPAHLPFSHHKLAGNLRRERAIPMPFTPAKVDDAASNGHHAASEASVVANGEGSGVLTAPPAVTSTARPPLFVFKFPSITSPDGFVSFTPPCTVSYHYAAPGMNYIHTAIFAVPTRPGTSRVLVATFPGIPPITLQQLLGAFMTPKLLQSMAMRFMFQKIPAWRGHLISNLLFDQDGVFLNMQDKILKQRHGGNWAKAYYMPSSSDHGVLAARKFFDRSAGGGPFPKTAGQTDAVVAPPRREEAGDRFRQHTSMCPMCQKQLKTLDQLQMWAKTAAAALFVVLCCGASAACAGSGPMGAVVAAVATLALAGCGMYLKSTAELAQKFYSSTFTHADNH